MQRLWSLLKDFFWLVVAVAIVGGGVYGFRMLGELREEVAAAPVERAIELVETRPLDLHNGPLPIRGEGFLTAFREVALSAETSGRILELHPAIDRHGRFAEGDILVRLGDRNARAALAQTEANVQATQARLDLTRIQLQRTETLFARDAATRDAVDRLASQEAELESTLLSLMAARDLAKLALENTQIIAPFDGAVLTKQAELGSVVSVGQSVAQVYTDRILEVTVPVRQPDAALIPGLFLDGDATATVVADFAGRRYQWRAAVVRVENELDSRTRTLNVTVRLDDASTGEALEGDMPASGAPPALINAFAKVTIDGVAAENVYPVPSTSVRENNTVWLFVDGQMRVHPSVQVHVDGEMTYVALADLPAGARIITSAIAAPIDGMEVREISGGTQISALME